MRGFAAGIIGGAVGTGTDNWHLGLAALIFSMVVFLDLKDLKDSLNRKP